MRWLMGLLALSLLLGPTLGQMHRAVHAGSASSSTAFVAHAHAIQAAAVTADAADCATGANACGADLAWVHGYAGPPAVLAFTAAAPPSLLPQPQAPAPRAIFVAAPLTARAPPSHLTLA